MALIVGGTTVTGTQHWHGTQLLGPAAPAPQACRKFSSFSNKEIDPSSMSPN